MIGTTKDGTYFVTCAQMKDIERLADEHGLSYYQMMENAGTTAAKYILAKAPEAKSYLVFCGKGNNGGDGYVVARVLMLAGKDVTVIQTDGEPRTDDAIKNYGLIKDNLHVYRMNRLSEVIYSIGLEDSLGKVDVAVDAIYGTGFHGKLQGGALEARNLAATLRDGGTKLFALDIPSGMNCDAESAEELGKSFEADYTITFHAKKPIHLQEFAQERCGEIYVADIGIDETTW